MLQVVKFIPEKHYKIIAPWWKSHGREPIPLELLPPTGGIVLDNGNPIFATFLIKTDTNVGIIEYAISSPNIKPKTASIALSEVINFLMKEARKVKLHSLWVLVCKKSMGNAFKRFNFIQDTKTFNSLMGKL